VVYIFLFFRRMQLAYGTKRKIILTFVIILSILLSLMLPSIAAKYKHSVANFNNWTSDESIYSSSGIRLDMWKSSLKALKDMPWHGYGYRLANKEVAKYSNFHSQEITAFTHLHNEYITSLMSAGILGLLSLISILFMPLFLFFSRRKIDELNKYAIAGIFICLCYVVFGGFHIAFGEEHVNALYVYLMSYLIPRVINSSKAFN
jgi:O-antigen ligase